MSEEIDFHRLMWDETYRKTLEQKSDLEILREENAALAAQVETLRADARALAEELAGCVPVALVTDSSKDVIEKASFRRLEVMKEHGTKYLKDDAA